MEVTMQEFESHLTQYVGQAQAGQVIELTSQQKVVARLVGVPPSASDGIAKLLASGRASWQGGRPTGAQLQLSAQGKSMSDIVLEDRA